MLYKKQKFRQLVNLQINKFIGSYISLIKMKYLYVFFIALCLLSCNKKQNYPHFLSIADTLVYHNPDSTVILLKKNADSIKNSTRSIQMYYRLLVIKADDKAYIPHTQNSEKDILELVQYYKRNKQILSEALYYAGRVYDDLQDSPQALEYYYKAIDASDSKTNKGLLGRIYSQIGTIYLYQDMYKKAIPIFIRASQYYVEDQDKIGILFSYRDLGRTYAILKQKSLAISYYQKAAALGRNINRLDLESMVLSELSGFYMDCGEYKLAYTSIQKARKYITNDNLHSLYFILSYYYLHLNQLDSAQSYVNKLLELKNIDKGDAYRILATISQKHGLYKQSMEYLQKSIVYADSTKEDLQHDACNKVVSLYNYQLRVKENTKLQLKTKNQELGIYLLLIAFCLLIILLLIYRKYYKMKFDIEKKNIKKLRNEQYKQSLSYIKRNEEKIKSLEVALDKAHYDKDELNSKLLSAQKDAYEKCNAKILADKTLQYESILSLKKTEIYKKFSSSTAKIILHEDDWKLLYEQVKNIYPEFLEKLQEFCKNELDFKMSILIKLDITPSQIGIDINRSKQWVTNSRKSLAQRLLDDIEAKPVDWDNFIRDL